MTQISFQADALLEGFVNLSFVSILPPQGCIPKYHVWHVLASTYANGLVCLAKHIQVENQPLKQ